MIIFTSVCANYIHKARCLAESAKSHIPDAKVIICLVEKTLQPQVQHPCFDEVVLAKDAWNGNFNRFIFKHTIVEASTSVKGQFLLYLLNRFPEEKQFVYLDPDVYIYSDFVELKELLKEHPIVLCPHLLQPGNIDMELSSTAHGVYNLGFLAVNNSEEARRCIQWWADRLYLFCYDDIEKGIFTDQKWFDLTPCFFDVKILKHHGYDFAPWSLLNCNMREKNGEYTVAGDPLRFIHFSGFGQSAENCMKNWLPGGGHPFKDLYEEYAKRHEINDVDHISRTTWSYANYSSGEQIDDSVRVAYRMNYDVMFMFEDPFEKTNAFYVNLLEVTGGKKYNIYFKIKLYLQKAKNIWEKEGVMVLIKKCIAKLGGKNL